MDVTSVVGYEWADPATAVLGLNGVSLYYESLDRTP